MQSIVSKEKKCLICGSTSNEAHLYKHYIFYSSGIEELSEKYGCWCYLCARHIFMSKVGVHCNTALDRKLKEHTQRRFNEVYPEKDFVRIFGKNYL